jgi:hypothetical protein
VDYLLERYRVLRKLKNRYTYCNTEVTV